MHRRTFLRAAAVTAGAAFVGSAAACASDSRPRRTGDVRIVAAGSPADPLDVGATTGVATTIAAAAIWDNLVSLTDGKVELSLAESATPDAAATTWRVTLKRATFHDGSPVTAKDALQSLRAMGTSTNFASVYEDVDLEQSTVDGDRTVVLRMRRPRSDLLEGVLSQASPVMLRGDAATKIGAGPFRYTSGDSQTGFRLARFDGYYLGRPAVDGLTIQVVQDPAARARALAAGSVDYAADLPSTTRLAPDHKVDTGMGGAIAYSLEMNTRTAPFDDPEVRRAVRFVFDRPRLVQVALGSDGSVGNDLVGVGMPGYDTQIAQRTRNLAVAKQTFAARGIKELSVYSAEIYQGMSAATELMVNQFADAGVRLRVENADAASYYDDLAALTKRPLFVNTYLNRPVAASLPLLTRAGATWNLNGFTTPAYQGLLNAAMSTNDAARRAEFYRRCQQILHSDGASVVWGLKRKLDGVAPTLSGISIVQGLPVFGSARWS